MHKKMLPDSAGIEPQPPDHQTGQASDWANKAGPVGGCKVQNTKKISIVRLLGKFSAENILK